jgi:hypothetical protein
MLRPAVSPGRLLERIGDDAPRGMTVLDRTRLTGRLRRHSLNAQHSRNPTIRSANRGPRAFAPDPPLASATRVAPLPRGLLQPDAVSLREPFDILGAASSSSRMRGPSDEPWQRRVQDRKTGPSLAFGMTCVSSIPQAFRQSQGRPCRIPNPPVSLRSPAVPHIPLPPVCACARTGVRRDRTGCRRGGPGACASRRRR